MKQTTQKLVRNYNCSLCNNGYEATRHIADKKKRFCSTACRTLSVRVVARAKESAKAARRLTKLPTNEFFLWISRECKRAGTVQALTGHTVESLEQLQEFYLFRRKCYGYNPATKTSKYHTSHIYPSAGEDRVGLLHPANLFVGDGFRNQKLGNKHAPDAGLSIPRSALKSEWNVDKSETDRKVLDKVSRFLGKTLTAYATDNAISKSTRFSLMDWILNNQAGRLEVPYSPSDLEPLSTESLRKIRAELEDAEYFQCKLPAAKRSFLVYFQEVQRLATQLPAGRHKEDCAWLVDALRIAGAFLRVHSTNFYDDTLDPLLVRIPCVQYSPLILKASLAWGADIEKEVSKLRDFIGFTSFQTLQGFPLNRAMVKSTLRKYFLANTIAADYSKLEKDEWTSKSYAESIALHREQVALLQRAMLDFDLITTTEAQHALEASRAVQPVPEQKAVELPWWHAPAVYCSTDLTSAPF